MTNLDSIFKSRDITLPTNVRLVKAMVYRGVMYSTDIISRIEITIICRDQFVEPAINAIMGAARTGEVGDGRIFVSPVDDTWSIRTGEHGDVVLADRK